MRKLDRLAIEIHGRFAGIEGQLGIIAGALREIAGRVASVDEMDKVIACAGGLGERLDGVISELNRIVPPDPTLPDAIDALKTKLEVTNAQG